MKKIFILLFYSVPFFANAQNLQLHYDLGKQEDGTVRHFFVSTFELFRPDTLGYTFLFTDFEFNSPDNPQGVSLGYFEIAREFTLPCFRDKAVLRNLGLHLEYNDGSVIYPANDSVVLGENLRSSWLAGPEYSFISGNLSVNTMFLFKYIRGSSVPDFQWTLVWYWRFFHDRFTLTGYADVWSQQDFINSPGEKILVLYSEPQVWYNITKHLAAGSEFKISKNFIPGSQRPEVFPTIGIRWEF